jgi:hypothetical protein
MNYKKCMSHEENTVTEAEGNLLFVITHFNLKVDGKEKRGGLGRRL